MVIVFNSNPGSCPIYLFTVITIPSSIEKPKKEIGSDIVSYTFSDFYLYINDCYNFNAFFLLLFVSLMWVVLMFVWGGGCLDWVSLT